MTIIKQNSDYKISLTKTGTYFLTDRNDDCCGYFPTERRALNAFKRFSKAAGIEV